MALVAIGYSILADHQLAEDVAQESFARALVNLRSLKDKQRFAPWLAAICRNVSKDMLTTKTKEISIDGFSKIANDDSDNEGSRAVHQAIEQLPESAKELVVLRYYNGLSYEQIGSAAMLSRALVWVARGRLLFSMPGSTAATELALERLILPELGHLLTEMRKV